jgi:hypothetical protein
MNLKLAIIIELSFICNLNLAQETSIFGTYAYSIERIALKPDSTFIFCRAVCLMNTTVSGRYKLENGVCYLDVTHRIKDNQPISIITLHDTAHIYLTNRTINVPLKPHVIELFYPMDLGVPEKFIFKKGGLLAWDSFNKKWKLFNKTTHLLTVNE